MGGIFLYMHGQRISVKNCMGAKCRLWGGGGGGYMSSLLPRKLL